MKTRGTLFCAFAMVITTLSGAAPEESRPELLIMSAHAGEVSSLDFSQSGKWLLSQGSFDDRAVVWNVAMRQPSRFLSKAPSMGFSPTDSILAIQDNVLDEFMTDRDNVKETQISPLSSVVRNRTVSASGQWEAFISSDNRFAIRRLPQGSPVFFKSSESDDGRVQRLRWAGHFAVAQLSMGTLLVVDSEKQELIRTKVFDNKMVLRSSGYDNRRLVVLLYGQGKTIVYDPVNDSVVREIDGKVDTLALDGSPPKSAISVRRAVVGERSSDRWPR